MKRMTTKLFLFTLGTCLITQVLGCSGNGGSGKYLSAATTAPATSATPAPTTSGTNPAPAPAPAPAPTPGGAVHQLPVVTHWDQALGAFLEGASDAFMQENPLAYNSANAASLFRYADRALPDTDQYLADRYSSTKVSDAEAMAFADAVLADTGIELIHLNPGAWRKGEVLSNSGRVQVVHCNIVAGSLATVFLPPNWDATAPAGTYPILFNGAYDVNQNTFSGNGAFVAREVANSAKMGGRGAVGIIWNGGGAAGTRTVNRKAYDQFKAVVDAATTLGASPMEIVAFGGSRGGVTALGMASNPYYPGSYRVVTAAAGIPISRLGELVGWQSPTFPGLIEAVTWTVGFRNAWRTGWTYPSVPGKQHLLGLTGPEAHLKVLTGERDPALADQHAIADDLFVQGLLAAGTQVYLEVGSHDTYGLYAHTVEYGSKLIAQGVPLHAEVNLLAGHRPTLLPSGELKIRDQAAQALAALIQGKAPTIMTGVFYNQRNRSTGAMEPFTPAHFPFTLEAPYVAGHGETVPLVCVGQPGTVYKIDVVDSAGTIAASFSGTIQPNMRDVKLVTIPGNLPTGTYTYALMIQLPGATSMTTVPATNTPNRAVATVTIFAVEPDVTGQAAMRLAAPPALPGFEANCWGLSEFVADPAP